MKSNTAMLSCLNSLVYGHEEAKRSLITMISRSQRSYLAEFRDGEDRSSLPVPMKVLLIGESGNGKTFLVESLRKVVDFPYFYVDATKLNPTGNSTGITETKLRKDIIDYCARCVTEMPARYKSTAGVLAQLVVFVDEVDKLGNSFESSGKWNTQVQANFLTLIDDKNILAGVSWVFAGAFTETRKLKEKRLTNKATLGFFEHKTTEVVEQEKTSMTEEDLLAGGLIPELVGRINNILTLDIITEEQYKDIITTRLLPKKLKELENLGVEGNNVIIDVDGMAKTAKKSGMGVRSLQRQLDKAFLHLEWDIEWDREMSYSK